MKKKEYTVLLNDEKIGMTYFEGADPSMGVVSGVLYFDNITSPYTFVKNYCIEHDIEFTDHEDDKLISTNGDIKGLKVKSEDDVNLVDLSESAQIAGMDSDVFEITILGVSHPFYANEFPHHMKILEEGE